MTPSASRAKAAREVARGAMGAGDAGTAVRQLYVEPAGKPKEVIELSDADEKRRKRKASKDTVYESSSSSSSGLRQRLYSLDGSFNILNILVFTARALLYAFPFECDDYSARRLN